nr:hypothetical protein Itr_chr07CG02210 [Ipomoea trifida]
MAVTERERERSIGSPTANYFSSLHLVFLLTAPTIAGDESGELLATSSGYDRRQQQ